ncbi:Hsp20/alpha crystallin family protein [Bacillus solitudinis]|uniref:Hsp20/alpha crystallin family protein n=1 Tax=Bacillus solitudinis TaxID=2014074 RepID=UPI0012FD57D1|nr:Hsp20/alpha crystallin family protein [Bacillus solitudinis]
MNSYDWNKPFQGQFQDEFWKSFNTFFNGNEQHLRVNLYQSGHELLCIVFLPGIKKVEDIHLNAYENVLEISGDNSLDYEGFQLVQQEISQGSFKRKIELPFSVRKDKIDASYSRGVLTIHLYRLIPDKNKNQQGIVIRDDE